MINTAWAKHIRRVRTENRDMPKAGWERLGEGGGKIWELVRGGRIGHRITEVQIAADGVSVWVKCANLNRA